MRIGVGSLIEGGVIVLGIGVLWPYILGHRSPWYTAATLLVLVLLACVAIVRVRRIKHALEKRGHEEGGQDGWPGHS